MSTSCEGNREQLINCISHSECMIVHKKSANECLKWDSEGVSEKCRTFVRAFFECKRGMLDNRNRFRGNKGF
eukprot:m.32787 g.32787  ORF g.32787 m.32787 type:complete len:72 (+) comp9421_c0_seq2:43-258(+)